MVKTSCTICKIRRCDEPLNFFTVPKNEGRRQRWVQACGKELKESAKICSKHFLEKDFIEPPGNNKRARLYPNAVPKVFLSATYNYIPKVVRLPPPRADPTVSRLLSNRKSLSVSVTHFTKTQTEQTPIGTKVNISAEPQQVQLFPHDFVEVCMGEKKYEPSREIRITGVVNTNGKVYFDSCSQTDDDYLRSFAIIESMDQKKKLRKLEIEIEKLKHELEDYQCINQNLSYIFTEGQLRRLRCPDRLVHWSRDDIASATNLHASGHNAYMYLYKQGFPLPSITTLKKWAQRKRKREKELSQMSLDTMSDNDEFLEEQEEENEQEEEADVEKSTEIIPPANETIKNNKKCAQKKIKREKELLQMSVDAMSDNDEFIEEQKVENEQEETADVERSTKIIGPIKVTHKETKLLPISIDNTKPRKNNQSDKVKTQSYVQKNKNAIPKDNTISADEIDEEIKIGTAVLSSDCSTQNSVSIPITIDMMEDKEDLSDDEKISVQSFDELKRDEVVLSYDKIKVKEETKSLFLDDIDEFLL